MRVKYIQAEQSGEMRTEEMRWRKQHLRLKNNDTHNQVHNVL